ncbi:hypothetical protein PV328_012043, partial [Microctonus aethiopoides]
VSDLFRIKNFDSGSPESGSFEKVPNGLKMEIFVPFRTFSELLFNIVNACAVGWMSEHSDLFRNKNFDSEKYSPDFSGLRKNKTKYMGLRYHQIALRLLEEFMGYEAI